VSARPAADRLRVLLLDADGSLFPSEAPAFFASADVTNRFLAALGVPAEYSPEHLLATTTGKNFRTTALDLARAHGVALEPGLRAPAGHSGHGEAAGPMLTAAVLDDWVAEEKKMVSEYLGRVLRPDREVLEPLARLAGRYRLAAVSSSALSRLDACFRATGLSELIPAERRYSAEDSLPRPTSKPDPAVYRHAAGHLGVAADQALAVEDSLPGVQSAVAAGITTVGNLTFVGDPERDARRRALTGAGAAMIITSWAQLAASLLDHAAADVPAGHRQLPRPPGPREPGSLAELGGGQLGAGEVGRALTSMRTVTVRSPGLTVSVQLTQIPAAGSAAPAGAAWAASGPAAALALRLMVVSSACAWLRVTPSMAAISTTSSSCRSCSSIRSCSLALRPRIAERSSVRSSARSAPPVTSADSSLISGTRSSAGPAPLAVSRSRRWHSLRATAYSHGRSRL